MSCARSGRRVGQRPSARFLSAGIRRSESDRRISSQVFNGIDEMNQAATLDTTKPTAGTSAKLLLPAALLITVLTWASAFAGIRAGLAAYSPTSVALLRYATASLVLAGYALVTRMPLPCWRDWPGLALLGAVGISV